MFTSASILTFWGMTCRFIPSVLWLAAFPTQSQASPQTPERGSGHEEVLGRINPQESDSIWEKGKKAVMYQMNRPYFRFNVASTATLVWLLLVLFVQRIIHRRAENRMVNAIADALAQVAHVRRRAKRSSITTIISRFATGRSKSANGWRLLRRTRRMSSRRRTK
jgi:hypothetical protein